MVRETHFHRDRSIRWTCNDLDCPHERDSELAYPWHSEASDDNPYEPTGCDLDSLHKKLDHAISAAFFFGGMCGLLISVALFAIIVFKATGK